LWPPTVVKVAWGSPNARLAASSQLIDGFLNGFSLQKFNVLEPTALPVGVATLATFRTVGF